MYMSVPIGSWGSYDPVITLKPLWGSPGTELSTWSTGSLCCIRAIQHSRFASRPLRSYTAVQRYTALYTIQLYIAIHYTYRLYNTPLQPRETEISVCQSAGGPRVHSWILRRCVDCNAGRGRSAFLLLRAFSLSQPEKRRQPFIQEPSAHPQCEPVHVGSLGWLLSPPDSEIR